MGWVGSQYLYYKNLFVLYFFPIFSIQFQIIFNFLNLRFSFSLFFASISPFQTGERRTRYGQNDSYSINLKRKVCLINFAFTHMKVNRLLHILGYYQIISSYRKQNMKDRIKTTYPLQTPDRVNVLFVFFFTDTSLTCYFHQRQQTVAAFVSCWVRWIRRNRIRTGIAFMS